jgi:uncharacterized SAM-binding protein YcdF (DUF218 family)
MWKMDFTQISTRAVILIGQFLIVVACIISVDFFYLTNIRPDKKAKESYKKTECFVISKKLSSKSRLFHTYRSDFLISYHVNGVQYNRWVSGNGLDMSYSRNAGEQGDILAQYDVGKNYTCWYDPKDMQRAMLVARHNWISVFPLMLPVAIGIISAYLMLRNLLYLLTAVTIKTRRKY